VKFHPKNKSLDSIFFFSQISNDPSYVWSPPEVFNIKWWKWGPKKKKQIQKISPKKKESPKEYSSHFYFQVLCKFSPKKLIAFGNSIHFLIPQLLWKNKILPSYFPNLKLPFCFVIAYLTEFFGGKKKKLWSKKVDESLSTLQILVVK
jgi:hypothetical protein